MAIGTESGERRYERKREKEREREQEERERERERERHGELLHLQPLPCFTQFGDFGDGVGLWGFV